MNHLKDLPLGLYEKAVCLSLSWEEKLLLTNNTGFDFLEICIDGEEPRIDRLYDDTTAKSLTGAVLNTGVPAFSMTLSANRKYPLGSEVESIRQKGIEVVKRAIDFSVIAGIRVIQLAPYCGGDERRELLDKFLIPSIEQCVAYAERWCVMLTFEAIDTQIMKSNRQVLPIVQKLDSPFFRIYADLGNLNAMGMDHEDELRACANNIVGVHIKDSKPGILRDIPLGEGTLDFDKCFGVLSALDYGGILAAETWCHENPDFHRYLPVANRFIRQALSRY